MCLYLTFGYCETCDTVAFFSRLEASLVCFVKMCRLAALLAMANAASLQM